MIPATSKRTMMISKIQTPFHSWGDYTQVKQFLLEVLVCFLDDIHSIWSFFSENFLRNATHGIVFRHVCRHRIHHCKTYKHTHMYIEYTQIICPCLKPKSPEFFTIGRYVNWSCPMNVLRCALPIHFNTRFGYRWCFFQQNLIIYRKKQFHLELSLELRTFFMCNKHICTIYSS